MVQQPSAPPSGVPTWVWAPALGWLLAGRAGVLLGLGAVALLEGRAIVRALEAMAPPGCPPGQVRIWWSEAPETGEWRCMPGGLL